MNKALSLTDGTILAEVLAYTGEMEVIPQHNDETLLFDEKEIGSMTELEKTLFTLASIKMKERLKIRESIIGKTLNDYSDEEKKTFNDYMNNPKNSTISIRFQQLKAEGKVLNELMWSLIKLRLNPEDSAICIRKGYKIVSGRDFRHEMAEMFNGIFGGIIVRF